MQPNFCVALRCLRLQGQTFTFRQPNVSASSSSSPWARPHGSNRSRGRSEASRSAIRTCPRKNRENSRTFPAENAADRCRLSFSALVDSGAFQSRSIVVPAAERCCTEGRPNSSVFAAAAMSTLLLCASPLLLAFVSPSLREFSISNFSVTFDLNFLWFWGQFSPLQLL